MKWITLLIYIYIAIVTFKYSKEVWKEKNIFASVVIIVMSISLIVLPIVIMFK
ncbi:hypothetical protein JK636_09565 [Clostridium sp. YIM B02515]|uniref:Uncharacterized protein n=1 Tax=Clostridium rhizosphaerae TaxID=2803861 RepID=A0ABS1TDF3_9CLOT|nr:hypothetical protein [Clostridium rhizosphaerae]MBL4936008.1 hypothetical protein [Clostridium rhizosphaerae]